MRGDQPQLWPSLAVAGRGPCGTNPPSLLHQSKLPPTRAVQPRRLAAEIRQEKSSLPFFYYISRTTLSRAAQSCWARGVASPRGGCLTCTAANGDIQGTALATCLRTRGLICALSVGHGEKIAMPFNERLKSEQPLEEGKPETPQKPHEAAWLLLFGSLGACLRPAPISARA